MRRRVSKKTVDVRLAILARSKEQRARLALLIEGKETQFWKEIQARVDSKAKGVEAKLDEWVGMPERELFAALEQRKIYRFFKDMVNEADNTMKMLDARIDTLEQLIKEKRVGAIV